MSGPSNPDLVSFFYAIDNQQNVVTFDASINEQHGGQAQVTDHPVEKGPNITDYVRPLPQRLSLEVMVSNTPIYKDILGPTTSSVGNQSATVDSQTFQTGNGGTITTPKATTLQFSEEFNRVHDVYDALTTAYKAAALIIVATTLKRYDNMVITNLGVPRNAENANAIRISVDLQELILVESSTVEGLAPALQDANAGQRATREVPASPKKERMTSVAKGMVDAFGRFLSGGGQ